MSIGLSKVVTRYPNLKLKSYVFDIVNVMFLLYLFCFLNQSIVIIGNIEPPKELIGAILNFIWRSSPILFIYLLFRIINIPIFLCSYLSGIAIITLMFVNSTKMALTGEPLSFNDIVSGFNLSVAGKYLNLSSITYSVAILIGAIISILLSKKTVTTRKNYISLFLLIIITIPFSFYPYIGTIFSPNNRISEIINSSANNLNIKYIYWNWSQNIGVNGLPMHIIQTSVRKSVPHATDAEQLRYLDEKRSLVSTHIKNKTIIYVLCESCWYDKKNFRENFKPVIDEGYSELRAISPVYGGGTANAEFEMLTGLPSNSDKISGIIYQEYSDAFKPKVDALPNALKNKGYITFAAHNYQADFWYRNKIYPKFGFDRFDSIINMGDLPPEYSSIKKPWQWQPDDYLLYNAALKAIQNAGNKDIFVHLITMSTHGPYQHINDYGEGVYTYEINEAVKRFVQFSQQVEKIDPNAVIVFYGDHKPPLNKYFVENGVLPSNIFNKIGEEKDEDFVFKMSTTPLDFGDVPVLIKSNDKDAIKKFITDANGKPFFCVSSLVDKHFIQSGLVSFNHNAKHVCENSDNFNYDKLINMTPSWIYSMSLFHD